MALLFLLLALAGKGPECPSVFHILSGIPRHSISPLEPRSFPSGPSSSTYCAERTQQGQSSQAAVSLALQVFAVQNRCFYSPGSCSHSSLLWLCCRHVILYFFFVNFFKPSLPGRCIKCVYCIHVSEETGQWVPHPILAGEREVL